MPRRLSLGCESEPLPPAGKPRIEATSARRLRSQTLMHKAVRTITPPTSPRRVSFAGTACRTLVLKRAKTSDDVDPSGGDDCMQSSYSERSACSTDPSEARLRGAPNSEEVLVRRPSRRCTEPSRSYLRRTTWDMEPEEEPDSSAIGRRRRTVADLDKEFDTMFNDVSAFSMEGMSLMGMPMTTTLSTASSLSNQWECDARTNRDTLKYGRLIESIPNPLAVDATKREYDDAIYAFDGASSFEAKITKFDALQARIQAKISAVGAHLPQLRTKNEQRF